MDTRNRQGARWRLYADGWGYTRARCLSGAQTSPDGELAGLGYFPVCDYRAPIRSRRHAAVLVAVRWAVWTD